jgi:hypothetical protein
MVAMSRSEQPQPPRTRLVGTLPANIPSAALIVMVLLAVGCGRTTARVGTPGPHPTATAAATPTAGILPEAHLSWTAGHDLPVGRGVENGPCAMIVTGQFDVGGVNDPGDGNIAYDCELTTSSSGGPTLWVTHDRAQHWKELAPLPSVGRQIYECIITPDAADPSIVVVAVSWEPPHEFAGPPIQYFVPDFAQFVSFDGGAAWQPLRGREPFLVLWLATYHGTTLASLMYKSGSTYLWRSTDQMQTWHKLPQTPSLEPFISPLNGDLVAVDINVDNQGDIEESTDLGQHWTAQPVPSDLYNGGLLVSPPVVGQPWRLCGYVMPSAGTSGTGTLMSSMDSGRTWTVRPELTTTFANTSKGLVVPETILPVAVGADGTIYAVLEESDLQPLGGPPAGLYQLTPQATEWQPLTLPPGEAAVNTTTSSAAVYTTDLPGSGIIWTATDGLSMAPSGWAGPFPVAAV